MFGLNFETCTDTLSDVQTKWNKNKSEKSSGDGQTFGSFLNSDHNDFTNFDSFAGRIDCTFPHGPVDLHMIWVPLGPFGLAGVMISRC